MTPRARRLATGVALLVIVLFVGRWSADFLTERWWAATISPAAVAAVTRWRLLGLTLDLMAMALAACWFALQAVLVARAIASVQIATQVGNIRLREAVPTQLLLLGAIATGVLLGLITGAGARQWRAPVALAWQGVHYGVRDPYLHEDVGVFVSQLPLWTVAHGFITLLAVLGLCFVAMLYAGIGAIRREQSDLVVHPYARRHLGLLLVAVAGVISMGYLLAPYQFITTPGMPMSDSGALTRIRSAQVMAGVALGVAVLSLAWIRRGRHALLAGGWLVLALGALVERIVVPALTAEASPPAGSDAVARKFDAMAWAIRASDLGVSGDTIPAAPAIWERSLLARFVEGNGGLMLSATQSFVTLGDRTSPAWLVAASVAGDSDRIDILAIEDGMRTPGGPPVTLRPADAPVSRSNWRTVGDARLMPNESSWRRVPTGVPVGNPLKRLLMAWSRQGGGIVFAPASARIDWHLDPTERAAALLPMASWQPADVVIIAGRPIWVVQGLIPLERFPIAARADWKGAAVGGVVPGFVATMDPSSGATRIYLDPGADSSATAWVGFSPGLVNPSAALPAEARGALTYPAALFEVQLEIMEGAQWALGRRPGRSVAKGPPALPVAVWRSPSQPGRQAAFEDPDRVTLSAIVTGYRDNGSPSIRVERNEGNRPMVENARELERLWGRMVPLMHVRDSARAAGDTVEMAAVRWFLGGTNFAAWQPIFAVPLKGAPSLLWVSTSLGTALGGGRTPTEGWSAVLAHGAPTSANGSTSSDAATVALARLWMLRADSALARGDLTAFGRAIEELRLVLKR